MKKLSDLKSRLTQTEILNSTETKDIIGGRRFMAYTRKKARKKLAKLRAKGKNPVMTEYGDHYCIEW